MVTQENYLFSGTIADNIRFGRPEATIEEIVEATTALGAHDFIAAMPDGYETDVANQGGRLSAGQRQLVAFARAFLADPAVLILDEATSSLDSPSERLVQHALRTVLAGRTAVIIAHRLSTVEIADRVLVMEHGRIVEDGSPGGPGRQRGRPVLRPAPGLGRLPGLSPPARLAASPRVALRDGQVGRGEGRPVALRRRGRDRPIHHLRRGRPRARRSRRPWRGSPRPTRASTRSPWCWPRRPAPRPTPATRRRRRAACAGRCTASRSRSRRRSTSPAR